MTQQTFLELSGFLAETMNFPAKDVPLILRRIRQFDTNGLLETIRSDTGRREGKLTREEAARVAILMAAFECGVSNAELEAVNSALIHQFPGKTFGNLPPSTKVDGGYQFGRGLATIIRGTAAPFNENWFLRIRFTRTAKGDRDVTAMVLWDGWDASENKGTKAADLLDGKTHLGTLLIPASDLIRPFLESAD